eukprot:365641-Chlamydomonas_euryale.AAC.6
MSERRGKLLGRCQHVEGTLPCMHVYMRESSTDIVSVHVTPTGACKASMCVGPCGCHADAYCKHSKTLWQKLCSFAPSALPLLPSFLSLLHSLFPFLILPHSLLSQQVDMATQYP